MGLGKKAGFHYATIITAWQAGSPRLASFHIVLGKGGSSMKVSGFFCHKWQLTPEQRQTLLDVIKRDDKAADDFLKTIEGHVGVYLGQLDMLTDDPEPSSAQARKLENDVEKLALRLIDKMEQLNPSTSNYQLRDALFIYEKILDPRGWLGQLTENLWTLADNLGRVRVTSEPLRRGRPINAPETFLVTQIAHKYSQLLDQKPSKSPTSRFYRLIKHVFDYVGQPKEDVRELIGEAIGKPKKRYPA
jgi:hypothetical protein